MTDFYELQSGPAPAMDLEAMEQRAATDNPEETRYLAELQREMQKLYFELRKYRDRNPNDKETDRMISQCRILCQLPCTGPTFIKPRACPVHIFLPVCPSIFVRRMPEHIFVFWPHWLYCCLVARRQGLNVMDWMALGRPLRLRHITKT